MAKVLDEQCPVYMSYGMSYREYWDGDNDAPRHYRELAKIRVKEKDCQAWSVANYVYVALARVYPLFNPFSNEKPQPFLEQPATYEMTREEQEAKNHSQMDSWGAFLSGIARREVMDNGS